MLKNTDQSDKHECLKLFWEFFKIGVFTIGGGAAMIPQMQQIAVEEKKWLTEEEMVDCIALGQSLPGVIAVNMATYIGHMRKGLAGALAATVGVVLPAFLVMLLAVAVLDIIGDNGFVYGAFTGMKAAVCGLIIVSMVRLGKQILTSPFQWVMMFAGGIAVCFLGVSVVWVILAGMVIGIVYTVLRGSGKK